MWVANHKWTFPMHSRRHIVLSTWVCVSCVCVLGWGGGIETHLWTLNSKSSWNCYCYKNHIFQCMCMICLCGISLVHLKFRAKYLAHTLKYRHFIQILLRYQAIGALGFKSSQVPGPSRLHLLSHSRLIWQAVPRGTSRDQAPQPIRDTLQRRTADHSTRPDQCFWNATWLGVGMNRTTD